MVNDIRSFFKPAEKPSRRKTPPPEPNTPRVWPSPRLPTRQRDASGSSTATSPVSSSFPPPDAPASRQASFTANPTSSNRPPTNSQSSAISTASKRAVVNGNIVVLDSDSESDTELYEELDFGLSKPPPQKATSDSQKQLGEHGSSTMRPPLFKKDNDDLKRPPKHSQGPRPSLSHLVQEVQKSAEAERRMKAVLADLEKPIEGIMTGGLAIDEDVLADVVHDEEEGEDRAKRLYLAMQRTNALDTECVFHFFGEANAQAPSSAPFPTQALPQHGWTACLEDPLQRDQAFLSGFALQVFQYQTLPPELAAWMIDQICTGSSHSLSAKYIQLLEAHPEHMKTMLDVPRLNKVISGLGVAIEKLQDLRPSFEPSHSSKRFIPPQLKSVLQLLQCAAKCLSPESRHYALSTLLPMFMDVSVLSDVSTLLLLQDTLESLIRYIPDRNPMLAALTTSLLPRLTHPILQNTLITNLPTKSPLTATFRRHLALSFLLGPTATADIPAFLSETNFSHLLHTHLSTSPALRITRKTNHASLAATISLLDVAIGPGPLPVPYHPPALSPSELTSTSTSTTTIATAPLFKPHSRHTHRTSTTEEETAFNKTIDALVQSIKLLGNGIIEAGAISDLSRLEAKDNVERLVRRLESAARMGGRRKRGVFEVDGGEGERGRKRVLGEWLRRGGKEEEGKLETEQEKEEEGGAN